MKRPRRIVSEQQQTLGFTRRAMVLGAGQAGIGALLAGRMAWLSVVDHAHYADLAERNRVQATLIPPRRGWIIDRAGKPIAMNRTDFRVDLIPDRMVDAEGELDLLVRLLGLSPDDIERVREDIAKAAGFRPVAVAENVDWARFAALSVRQPDLPGVLPSRGFSRFYPDGAGVAHLVGYVGPASADAYAKTHDPLLITPGFKTGKDGLEKTMEPWLRGQAGAKRTEVTARGRVVQELTTRPDQVGHTLQLTIDAALQDFVARRLGPNSGAVTVIEVETGHVLAMCSMPAYDPNSFSDGISRAEWAMLSGDDHLPLLNKTLLGLYPPGSTVKPMMALAAQRWGVDPHEIVHCTGAYRVGNTLFHCWQAHGHGAVDMEHAIQQSCDVYFYTMGRRIGIDKVAPMARLLGLGEKFALPYSAQRYGTVPDTAWKLRHYNKPWTTADMVNASIGQGYVLVNPLQLAVMAARIASGRAIQPRLILNKRYGPQGGSLEIPTSQLDIVHAGMRDVVNSGAGTARASRLPLAGIEMAGKTGSAQVRHISMADRAAGRAKAMGESGAWHLRDHAHFIGFAPADRPKYAIGVTLEHGGHGPVAAQVAREVMTFLFAPDRGLAALAAMEKGWGGGIAERMARDAAIWRNAHGLGPAPAPDAGAASTAAVQAAEDNRADAQGEAD